MALLVEDVMNRGVITIESNASAKVASVMMTVHEISSLVVQCDGELIGILTEKDLVTRVIARGLNPDRVRVLDIMTKGVMTVRSYEPIENAVKILISNGIKKLPVIGEPNDSLVGMLSQTDVATLYPDLYAKAAVGKAAAQVGHDIRGPLNTIINSIYLLERYPDKQGFCVNTIKKAVETCSQILDDMKSKTSETLLAKLNLNLNAFVTSILDSIVLPDNILLERNLQSDVWVSIDSAKMRRVLDNILKNSVEAMPDGGSIIVSIDASDEWASLTVKDNGCGIPDEIMHNLYTPFVTSKTNGSGLGLSFSKRIINAHKGDIQIDSKSGLGTTLTIRLPPIQAPRKKCVSEVSAY